VAVNHFGEVALKSEPQSICTTPFQTVASAAVPILLVLVLGHPFQAELAMGLLGYFFFLKNWPARDAIRTYLCALLVFSAGVAIMMLLQASFTLAPRMLEQLSIFANIPNYQPLIRQPPDPSALVAFAPITFAFVPILFFTEFDKERTPQRLKAAIIVTYFCLLLKIVIFFIDHKPALLLNGETEYYDVFGIYDPRSWLAHLIFTGAAQASACWTMAWLAKLKHLK
jgi:hypothetical protein